MTSQNINLAFSSLKERSIATSSALVHDRIFLTDYIITAEIGAFSEEFGKVQRLRFNVVVEVQNCENLNDDVDKILSYDTIITAIQSALSAGRINLLETLAENIANQILALTLVHRVLIRIEKLDRGPYMLGVEIVRSQGPKTIKQPKIAPKIIFFDAHCLKNNAININRIMDKLHDTQNGVILCIETTPSLHPQDIPYNAHHLQIDLLHLEQEAWKIALNNDMLAVIHSQTELEAKMAENKIVIWAPLRTVISTPELRKIPFNPLHYYLWLAQKIQVKNIIAFGQIKTINQPFITKKCDIIRHDYSDFING